MDPAQRENLVLGSRLIYQVDSGAKRHVFNEMCLQRIVSPAERARNMPQSPIELQISVYRTNVRCLQ